tara:strand:- start:23963 stop:26110 length:2148 start_codon:yes stop_codon:yes gene_type:complete
MSNTLYLNKAQRLNAAADARIEAYINQAIDASHNSTLQSQGISTDMIRDDLNLIFQQWQEHTKPRLEQFDNGHNLLIIPLSEIKMPLKKNKKKNAMSRTASARLLLSDSNGAVDIFRLGGGDKGTKSLEDGLNYYTKIANGQIDLDGNPRHGRAIDNYERGEFEKIFTQPIARYQGKTSPAAYLQSRLREVANKYDCFETFERDNLSALIQDVEATWLKSAKYSFLAIANRKALRAILLNSAPSLHDYQWLTRDIDARAQDKRLGAFMSYPGMMPLFTRKTTEQTYSRGHAKDIEASVRRKQKEDLAKHIDDGLSVAASLKNTFTNASDTKDTPPKYLGVYHGANDTVFGNSALKLLTKNIDNLSHFKREHYPKTAREWSAFDDDCSRLNRAAQQTGIHIKRLVDHYETASNGTQNWGDIGDFIQKMTKTLIFPLAIHIEQEMQNSEGGAHISAAQAMGSKKVSNAFLELFTIPQLIRGSKEWHERTQTVNAALKSISVDSDLSWPELIPETVAPNGVKIAALTSKPELEDEGTAMAHCVGGYASNCILQGAHILHLSISDSDGTPHNATLQLSEVNQGGRTTLSITQNRAESNRPPESRLLKASEWLVSAINEHKIEVDWPKIREGRNKAAQKYEENKIINQIGFDPHNIEHCETAYETMKRFLPKRMQGCSYQDYAIKSGLAEQIRQSFEQQIAARATLMAASSTPCNSPMGG